MTSSDQAVELCYCWMQAVLLAALANKVRASQHTKSLPIKRTAAVDQGGAAQEKAGGLRAAVVTNTTLGKVMP